MSQICKSNLVIKALNNLSTEDYVAGAIISYNKQLNDVTNLIKRGIMDNEALKKYGESYNYLTKLFKEALKEDYDKVKDKDNYNELTALYILNNFIKLCPNKMLLPYYERISFLIKKLQNCFSIEMQLGIVLRSSLIINKLSKSQNKDALEKFVSLLEKTKGPESNLLYVIYYGLFDGTINNKIEIDTGKAISNEEVSWNLLDNNDKLPDSIITELCKDEQFNSTTPDIVLFVVNLFFRFRLFPKLPDDDMLDIIQKIFNNNVRDFDSKAEFLDLSKLIKEVEQSFYSSKPGFGFGQYFADIVNGIETLDRREDRKDYGSI